MRKVLVINDSPSFLSMVKQILENRFWVVTCEEVSELMPLVCGIRPDILVLDLTMPRLDGISLLTDIRNAGVETRIIVTTLFLSTHVVRLLEDLGVVCVLRKPFTVERLTSRILELEEGKETPDQERLRRRIQNLLLELSFSPNVSAYDCLVEAILRKTEDMRIPVTKELYPLVALKCGTSPGQVERGIRHLITKTLPRQDTRCWSRYFPPGRNGKVNHVSNHEFISRIAMAVTAEPVLQKIV